MAEHMDQDKKIKITYKDKVGEQQTVWLEEFSEIEDVKRVAQIAKNVVIQDTADVIFRVFAKVANKDADLQEISKRLPCLGKKYLQHFIDLFKTPEIADALQRYNSATDKKVKREIRNNIFKLLTPEIENNIEYDDLYFNFSKFKLPAVQKSRTNILRSAIDTVRMRKSNINHKDPFERAVFLMCQENAGKRAETPRQAHWFLIKDTTGNVIGMTFISSKQLNDKRVNKKIVGHSGQILDPAVQGKGYVSAIKSVMVDFMYENMDEKAAQESLFATTCNEFNENSQGLQYKSGAKPFLDENGNIQIDDAGKIHWYASKEDIMNSEMMRQAINNNVTYEVMPMNGQEGYIKTLGQSRRPTINQLLKGIEYDK